MSLLNRFISAVTIKGFSPLTFVMLLACVSAIITLMLASIAGVGVISSSSYIIETYHSQIVRNSDAFVVTGLERLIKSTSQKVLDQWENLPVYQNDFEHARHNLAAFYFDPTSRNLKILTGSGNVKLSLHKSELPFKSVVENSSVSDDNTVDISLPRLPSGIDWQISRHSVADKSAWIMWGAEEGGETGIWGFRLFQDDLRPELVKLLRRVCHDNHMQMALVDKNGDVFIAADYRGELKGISKLVAGKNQELLTREPSTLLSGMKVQIVYTPGIFGIIPDWVSKSIFVLIALVGSILASTMVYFYGMERQSNSQLRLQNDWVLNLAHSLRGPCHSLGVLLEAIKNTDHNVKEELFQLGHREIEAMDAHCRSFLQMARKELGSCRVSLSSISLDECLRVATERVLLRYPQFDKSDLEVVELNDVKVVGDRMVAEEVLITLIDNAVKFSIGKKNIKISGNICGRDFVMQIQDSGAGISPEDISQIGQPFFRSSRPELEGVPGTGVGLYLTQAACVAMRWQFKIDSEGSDKGTLVTLVIPMELK